MSSKTIAQKLQLKEGHKFLLVNPPAGYRVRLGPLPENANVVSEPSGQADIIQIFVSSKAEMEEELSRLKPVLGQKVILWVTHPKGASKIKTDLNRDIIREHAHSVGLEAVAIFSVDEDWSALRLKRV